MFNRTRKAFDSHFGGPRTIPAAISGSRIFASGWSATGLAIMVACAFGAFVASGGGTTGIILAAIFLAAAPVFAAMMGVAGNYIGRWRDNVAAQELADFQKVKSTEDEAKQQCENDLEKAQYLATYFVPQLQKASTGNLKKVLKQIDREIGGLPEDGELYALVFKRIYLMQTGMMSIMQQALINREMQPLIKNKIQRIAAELQAGNKEAGLILENGLVYHEINAGLGDLAFNEQLLLIAEKTHQIEKDLSMDSLRAQFSYYFYDKELSWLEDNLPQPNKETALAPVEREMPEAGEVYIPVVRSQADTLSTGAAFFKKAEAKAESKKGKEKDLGEVKPSSAPGKDHP